MQRRVETPDLCALAKAQGCDAALEWLTRHATYDSGFRVACSLAASEGRLDVLQFLAVHHPGLSLRDDVSPVNVRQVLIISLFLCRI